MASLAENPLCKSTSRRSGTRGLTGTSQSVDDQDSNRPLRERLPKGSFDLDGKLTNEGYGILNRMVAFGKCSICPSTRSITRSRHIISKKHRRSVADALELTIDDLPEVATILCEKGCGKTYVLKDQLKEHMKTCGVPDRAFRENVSINVAELMDQLSARLPIPEAFTPDGKLTSNGYAAINGIVIKSRKDAIKSHVKKCGVPGVKTSKKRKILEDANSQQNDIKDEYASGGFLSSQFTDSTSDSSDSRLYLGAVPSTPRRGHTVANDQYGILPSPFAYSLYLKHEQDAADLGPFLAGSPARDAAMGLISPHFGVAFAYSPRKKPRAVYEDSSLCVWSPSLDLRLK
ncbi:hypothetical protein PHLCEN_2v7893 [Hermanssonia centrifuga]|uniref:Uncharacterized protein n=1 Tax=Hermanssonia centrifuga TaxID=98765 RepID=A0A2R6NVA6_9APHY|nr:hypothetical protein PHLCEN_2v7893 [Hermanssonia centrifuga]